MRAAATVLICCTALPALAERTPSIYPAAQCAALWLGSADYGALSAYLDRDETDLDRAEAFRAVAYRLDTAPRAKIDAYIARQRPQMVRLMDAVIYRRDRTSRDIFERLTKTCEDFGQAYPETRKLS